MNAPPPPTLPRGLYALCDDSLRPELPLPEKAALLLQGGARVLQLRMKHTPLREGLAAARAIAQACERAGALLIVNDRVDLALLSGAHGVHVGDEDLPPEAARALLGPTRLVGVTVRSAEGARAARAAGADYVGLGPVFATRTKAVPAPVLGLTRLAEEVRASPLPVVAIGGVGLENIADVARAGAHCAAVASDALLARDVAERVGALASAFDRGALAASLARSRP
ncbi:thiamine phosphate synthase [Aggregicoccus sp. 17bor-14]|uniref:thiamine phosphate synthase n=1 Tax=Myxococcaceae TaxID=31 RepID=UPI00129C41BA|nr:MULTISPECIES: thiamine phosphate synthase [Myxococcaceae]MBF5042642.1 thiamine phosphate synthase [Simulacricoccus sp. 17bor-14]MRI88410.1 thiamine phosphate synthase [Aggregicoccus sp. 17bor-14]